MPPIGPALDVVLPLFGLMGAGYALGRSPIWSDAGTEYLTRFVFYVALPALLFRLLGGGHTPIRIDPSVIAAYFGGCLIVFAGALAFSGRVLRRTLEERALFGMGSVFANSVQLGIPLVVLAFGEAGVVPLSMIIAFNAVILITLASSVVEIARSGAGARLGPRLWKPVAGLARNPIIIAIVAGLLYGTTGIGLHSTIDRFAKILGDTGAGAALVTLGAGLAAYRLEKALVESLAIAAFKLLAHPLAVWVLARHVFALDPTAVAVATVTAALPVGANVFILARHYGVYAAPVSASILVSTILSAPVVALLLTLFAPHR